MITLDLNKQIKLVKTVKNKLSIKVVNKSTGEQIFSKDNFTSLKINQTYYTDLLFMVTDMATGKQNNFDMPLLNIVIIEVHSKALGDQIAWMPIIELFRKKNKCKVIVRCHFGDLFRPFYPKIEFRRQYFEGDTIENEDPIIATAVYVVGYSLSGKTNEGHLISPVDCRTVSLQEIACYQLGIKPQEKRPKFKSNIRKPIVKGKYVCIATGATAIFKLWNNTNGWQGLIKYFKSRGYKIIDVGDITDNLEGTISMNGNLEWNELMNILKHAKLFVSSTNGLQWLAWAVGQKVVTINGNTEDWAVFKHTQISNREVCNGCWNDTKFVYDNNDINYCPRNKDYICTSSITPEKVINEIKKVL